MKFKIMFLKSYKHLLQMVHMISWGQAKKHVVINVTFGKTKTHQHSIHDLLNSTWAFFKPNGKNLHEYEQSFPWGSIPQKVILTLSPSLNGN